MTPTKDQVLAASAGWVAVVLNVVPGPWSWLFVSATLEGLLDHLPTRHDLVCGGSGFSSKLRS